MSSGLPVGHSKYAPYVCDTTKALATFGDVDFIEYGGQLLVPGVSEDDQPYLEIIEQPTFDEMNGGDWKDDAKWIVYRVEPEQLKLVEDEETHTVYLVCAAYKSDWSHALSQYDEWFHKDFATVAEYGGATIADMRGMICSDDPRKRAAVYILLAEYHGWHEFDSYPLSLTQHEVYDRYGLPCECPACERCLICGELPDDGSLDDDGQCRTCVAYPGHHLWKK